MPAWVRCGRLLAAALGLAASGTAAARPLTVEDVLAREAIGRVALSDRWAIAEVRRPYETAWRFDLDMRTDALRTGIEVSDLRRPTPLRPLFPAEPGVGYALGPIAPDGERIIVFRLKGDAWELGVAEIASSQVRWLDVAPELTATGEAAAWIGRDAVAVITAPNEFGSFDLRLRRYPALLSARRAVTAAGGVSATAIGSGRHLSMTPAAPPNQLLRFDLSAGSLRTLATGRFTDLEVSPSGRWIAAFRSGAIIPLDPARPVQGAQGIEMRRTRLSLIDATTGAETAIAPERDMLGQLLRWSPEADELLVFGRRDGESWADGRLLRVTPRGGARPLATPGFRPIVLGRPGVVHAGWLGGAPVVYGEAAVEGSSPRRDWFLLRRGARNLTGFLARAPRPDPTIIADGALWLPQPGGLWRIDDKGARRAIQDETAALAVAAIPGLKRRQDQAPYIDHPVVGVSATGPERQLLWPGGSPPAPMPADARILAVGAAGVLVTAWRSDAGEEVAWIARSRTVTALKRINAHLASVDALRVAPVRHARPGGGTLTSWLVLPQGRAARPPPLVVWPYPGSVYPSFPAYMQVLTGGELETPALLAGRGYAVLVPSLPLDHAQAGPAAGLAQQVLDIIDAARGDPALRDAFDPRRLVRSGRDGHGAGRPGGQRDLAAQVALQVALGGGDREPQALSVVGRRLGAPGGLARPGERHGLEDHGVVGAGGAGGLGGAGQAGVLLRVGAGLGVAAGPIGRIRRAEVLGEQPVPAYRSHGVAADLPQLALQGELALGRKSPVFPRQAPMSGEVRGGEEQHALGRQTVAARSPRFLLVVLHGARGVGVDHGADVGAVDPHPEGDGGHHHVQALVYEIVLGSAPVVRGQARVIGRAGDPLPRKPRGQPLHVLARLGVDDASLSGMAAHDAEHLGQLVSARKGSVDEVGPVRVSYEAQGLAQGELGADILLDSGGRRRGQGHAGGLWEALHDLSQSAILGPELVAPVRDAVSLVHRYQDQAPGDILEQVSHEEALGADVEELCPARGQPPIRLASVVGLEVRMEGVRGQAGLSRRGHLVIHEGDEGRDDQDEPPAHGRGQLVAEAFSPSGRQHDQAVAPGERRLHGLPLERLEGVVAPAALERFLWSHSRAPPSTRPRTR